MKRLRLLFLIISIGLAGCNKVPVHNTPAEDHTPEVVLVDDNTPEEPAEPEVVIDTDTDEPKVFNVIDLVSYFNTKGAEEGVYVSYVAEEDYWYLRSRIRGSSDISSDNLSSAIPYFLQFLPLYKVYDDGFLFRYMSNYIDSPDVYFIYVATSSNHFAACSIYSYIESDYLTVEVIIYDGRSGLYI